MILKHNYYYFKKAISLEYCKQILKAGRKKIIKEATTFKGINKTKRNCKVAWMNEKWIYDIINPYLHAANKKAGWNFQWDWNEKNINGKVRKLSLTLQLTDQTEYEGGDFQFMWIDTEKKDLLNITTVENAKDIGTIIVFPSFIHHQVLPITKGKRESLVNWSVGKPFI